MRHRTVAVVFLAAWLAMSLAEIRQSWAQTKTARIGMFTFEAGAEKQWLEPFFLRALVEQGWIEGKNVSLEYRTAVPNDSSQLAKTAADLVRLKVDVIFADSAPAVRAAYGATHTIPIVGIDFTNDPVAVGYAQSYGRPGGNVTGVFLDAPEFAGKWLELLRAMIPSLTRVAVLWDPAPGRAHLEAVQHIAQTLHVQLQVLEVRNPDDIDRAFSEFRPQPQALIALPSPMIYAQSRQLAKLALEHRLPATSMASLFAQAGGMLSYGPDAASAHERGAVLVAKILAGAKAGELPVERPTKIQLIVNQKTARALGVIFPESILLRADEVIR